jgi:hypothetical protein
MEAVTMAHPLIHPALRQTLRAAAHRVGQLAIPDDNPPTLMLGDTPPPRPQARPATDAAHALVIVVCTAILSIWCASALAGATWDDALRVLATLAGA